MGFQSTVRRIGTSTVITQRLLAEARIVFMSSEELRPDTVQRAYSGGLVSVQNERAVLRWLTGVCTARLARYPSNTAEVTADIDETDARGKRRAHMAAIVIADETALLQSVIELCTSELSALERTGEAYKPLDSAERSKSTQHSAVT